MAEMCSAQSARNFSSCHAQGKIIGFVHIFLGNRRPEAWPACAGLEFGFGAEERRAATDAAIETFVVIVPILTGERALCGRMTRYFERGGG